MLTRLRLTGIWRYPNFLRFWLGSTVSLFGSQITFVAFPFIAALMLHATPAQMGILSAADTAPFLLGGMFAGVWVDRVDRRRLLIGADIGRAILLSTIPLMAFTGLLRIEYLYVVAFLVGFLTLFFTVAYGAFLPSLITHEHLGDGNSKLQASTSAAEFAGPALAGVLVQLITAPLAIIVDAISFVFSAVCLISLKVQRSPHETETKQQNFWHELLEGLRFTFRSPILRALIGSSSILNFTGGVFSALLVLYITQDLGLGAVFFGVIYAIGSLSGLGGALLGNQITRKLGTKKVILISALLIALGWLFVPLARGSALFVIGFIVVGAVLFGIGNTLFNINSMTLVQTSTPNPFLGRVNSSATFIGLGSLPIGALLGGVLGGLIGVRLVLLTAGLVRLTLLIFLLAPLWKQGGTFPLET